MGLALFTGLVTAFEVPIRQSMVAELTGRESLMNAIALQSSVFQPGAGAGAGVRRGDLRPVGRGGVLLPQRASFLAVIWGLYRMDLPDSPPAKVTVDVIGAFREGARYVRHERWPRALMILIASTTIFGFSFLAMLPVYARDVLAPMPPATARWCREWAWARSPARSSSRPSRHAPDAQARAHLGRRVRNVTGRDGVRAELLGGVRLAGGGRLQHGIAEHQCQHAAAAGGADHLRGRVMGFYSFVVLGMAPFGALPDRVDLAALRHAGGVRAGRLDVRAGGGVGVERGDCRRAEISEDRVNGER